MKAESLQHLVISANFAISADGKISSFPQRPSGWTSREDHQRLLDLRRGADAILVGRRTLLADRMSLTVPGLAKQPLRCIASASGHLSGGETIFRTPGGGIHLWCPTPPATLPEAVIPHHGSLTEFLLTLHHDYGVQRLHCEGGGTLMRLMLEQDLLDELHLTWAAHTLFGGTQSPTISGATGIPLPHTKHFCLTHFDPRPDLGEVFLSYRRSATAQ
jgi:2,5-diamino-6-(ribosylamino)-4(3H)-pyrimidinone 5'-phosphate reductase